MYEEDADDIIGILNTRDWLLNARKPAPKPLRQLLRPAYFVPESVRADILFRDMQSKKVHLSIVVDEYGGTSGLVTMEDLLEEIVGNIYDEFDPLEDQEIVPLGDNLWRIAGGADLDDVARALDVEFPEDEDTETLGGLVFAQLSVIPEDGSHPEVDALRSAHQGRGTHRPPGGVGPGIQAAPHGSGRRRLTPCLRRGDRLQRPGPLRAVKRCSGA